MELDVVARLVPAVNYGYPAAILVWFSLSRLAALVFLQKPAKKIDRRGRPRSALNWLSAIIVLLYVSN